MRHLSDSEVLDLVDAGRARSADQRAFEILRRVTGETEEALAQLPRGRVDALLLEARAQTIGPHLEACIACPACGTLLEAAVGCDELAANPPDAFEVTCDSCGTRSSSAFDIRTFFWRELSARAQHIVLDVHVLACAYGWRESDVLALSPARRRRYLELVGEPGPFNAGFEEDLESDAERAVVAAVSPRAPQLDGMVSEPRAEHHAATDAARLPQLSRHDRHEKDGSRAAPERAPRREAVHPVVQHQPVARPARLAAAAVRRETPANPPVPAMPQVTVNIARIDVVATPAQAATIATRPKRRDAAMPLSAYLARDTEAR